MSRDDAELRRFIARAAILTLAALVIAVAVKHVSGWFGAGRASKASVNADQYERERVERAERVCRATRSRVQRGAAIGPTDTEGWWVELVLTKNGAEPRDEPALGRFLTPLPDAGARRVTWSEAPELSRLDGIDTEVDLASESLEPGSEHGLRITFKGKYVAPYFDPADRLAYFKLANALAEALGATSGALYARCAQSASHELGSWFLGPDPAAAAASLVFFIGAFNDPPQVRESILFGATGVQVARPNSLSVTGGNDVRTSGSLGRIRDHTHALDRKQIRELIGPHEGMLSSSENGKTVLSFPFNDANRAARASYELARASGVGLER